VKYWIDVTSLPHVHFFRALAGRLQKSGNEVFITSREFGVMNEILKKNGMKAESIGEHGGKDVKEKLIKSSERVAALARAVSMENPDVALSKHSIESARVAFGLCIPSVMVIDHETARKQTRLTAPLADVVVAPQATPKADLESMGASDVRQFHGVCETAHFYDFTPSDKVLAELGLSMEDTIVIARSEPLLSSHNFHESKLFQALERIRRDFPDVRVVLLPRDAGDSKRFEKAGAIVPEHPVDTLSLYHFASLMIGAGSCMNREAAVGGCPTISVCPDRLPGVDRFLIEKGLMQHSLDVEDIVARASAILGGEKKPKKVQKADFECPYAKVLQASEELAG
jgi:predicted glycosyltransferase